MYINAHVHYVHIHVSYMYRSTGYSCARSMVTACGSRLVHREKSAVPLGRAPVLSRAARRPWPPTPRTYTSSTLHSVDRQIGRQGGREYERLH